MIQPASQAIWKSSICGRWKSWEGEDAGILRKSVSERDDNPLSHDVYSLAFELLFRPGLLL